MAPTSIGDAPRGSDAAIRKIKATERVQRLFDGGLYLEVTPTGARYWRLKYRHGEKEKRLAIGVYPVFSLAAGLKEGNPMIPIRHRGARATRPRLNGIARGTFHRKVVQPAGSWFGREGHSRPIRERPGTRGKNEGTRDVERRCR